jgi:hypothetical protein
MKIFLIFLRDFELLFCKKKVEKPLTCYKKNKNNVAKLIKWKWRLNPRWRRTRFNFSPQKQAQSTTPRLFFCSLCLRVCSLSGSHNQMRLTVPTKTHCCCLTCVRETFSRTKNQLVVWVWEKESLVEKWKIVDLYR